MTQSKNLNPLGAQLSHGLDAVYHQKQVNQQSQASDQKVHVVGAGGVLTAAYEQLRIAAEYTEEHLLLQRAIRRFYKRLFLLKDSGTIRSSGEELIIELTQAGYLANDTVSEKVVQDITKKAKRYYDTYTDLQSKRGVSQQQAEQWTYEVLAVEIEWQLHDATELQAFTQFAHGHFMSTVDFSQLFKTVPQNIELALYVAIHRALLKSDEAAVRFGLLRRYQQSVDKLEPYVETNRQIDTLFTSPTTEKLYRVVDRQGAHLRVLRHMIEEDPSLSRQLTNQTNFLTSFEAQVEHDYDSVNSRVNKGIVRSVIFLIITKFLIGIAIEIPYDYLVLGMVLWTPLLINLFFPPVYMVFLRTTLLLPSGANTKRLVDEIEQSLYVESKTKKLLTRRSQSFGMAFNIVYAAIFVAVFGSVAWVLWNYFGFELLHLTIFFIFLSGASFLGFRLSRMIRELEAVETNQNAVTTVRDFLYMPFVVVGRYMNEKYSKVNIVALALDMLIELPLKTTLRLVRQWAAFISSKKDEL